MPDKPSFDPPEQPDPADLPPAAQWMMAQAAAADTTPERAAAELSFTPLAQRRERVLGGLRGNDKLTAGLGTAAAAALTEWGAAMGRHVVAETDGLDDATARALARWKADAGRPAEQIAGLRAFVEGQLRPEEE